MDNGIERDYIDTWGRHHTPSEETIRLISAAQAAAEDPALTRIHQPA